MNNPHGRSRLITWSGGLGLLCLLLMPLGVALVRWGLPFFIGLGLFSLASLACLILTALLALLYLLPRYRNHRLSILINVIPSLPATGLILFILGTSLQYPPIHDITTNTDNPPLFDVAPMVRGKYANSLDIKPESIALQLEAYPDIKSIETNLPEELAFGRAERVAESLGWIVYNTDPMNRVIEASFTSDWFGFVDDIVIRTRPIEGGTAIDLRSVSRVGRSDLGANAMRIRAFIKRFNRY